MKHFLLAPGLLLFVSLAWATEPPADAVRGTVLVLRNDRIIEGEVERIGTQYRVRRTGGETWVPASQVHGLCADFEAAYQLLRGEANLDDAAERLRLARFCATHQLRAQALEEARAALTLRPGLAEAGRLVTTLERSPTGPTAPAPATAPPAPENTEAAVDPATLDAIAFTQFVNRVQPVLMNACANCHATGRGGSFKLARAFTDGGVSNRKATQQNLSAVLGMLNRDRPLDSPLLTRSVALHGHSEKPPLKGRTEPAYRSLEDWVQMAASAAPVREAPVSPAPTAHPMITATAPSPPETPPVIPETPPPATPPSPSVVPAAPTAMGPAAAPSGSDPYDPAIFNRRMHPHASPR